VEPILSFIISETDHLYGGMSSAVRHMGKERFPSRKHPAGRHQDGAPPLTKPLWGCARRDEASRMQTISGADKEKGRAVARAAFS